MIFRDRNTTRFRLGDEPRSGRNDRAPNSPARFFTTGTSANAANLWRR